jgi:hypothetical protein
MNPARWAGIACDMPKRAIQNSTASDDTAGVPAGAAHSNGDGDAVANLAYQLWTERGRPEGSPEEDWFRAQELLRNGRAAGVVRPMSQRVS